MERKKGVPERLVIESGSLKIRINTSECRSRGEASERRVPAIRRKIIIEPEEVIEERERQRFLGELNEKWNDGTGKKRSR